MSLGITRYYEPGNNQKNVAPDVFVVRGVGKHQRRMFKIWEEGRAPVVVVEVSSSETREKDLERKKDLYAKLGLKEYFIFDPEYKLKPPFRAFRLSGDQYVEIAIVDGRARSVELGLDFVDRGQTLRLFNPQTGRFLPTPEEEAARATLLAAKLRELGADPDQIKA